MNYTHKVHPVGPYLVGRKIGSDGNCDVLLSEEDSSLLEDELSFGLLSPRVDPTSVSVSCTGRYSNSARRVIFTEWK